MMNLKNIFNTKLKAERSRSVKIVFLTSNFRSCISFITDDLYIRIFKARTPVILKLNIYDYLVTWKLLSSHNY